MVRSNLQDRLISLLDFFQNPPGWNRNRFFIDLLLVTCLIWIGFSAATSKLNEHRASGQAPFFYQISFQPAVLLACGRKFGVPETSPTSLTKFVKLEVDHFSCEDLPADLKVNPRTHQSQWFYMMQATGYLWQLTGISWSNFDILPALFVGISIACIYGFFRLAFSIPIALFGALYVFFSQAIVDYAPFFRDLSKAPFILAALLILAVLVKRDRLSLLAIPMVMLAGVVIGIGYGFRPDVVIIIPLFFLSVLVFLPGHSPSKLLLKSAILTGFLASFFITAYPMLSMAREVGTCTFHWALLGTGSSFLPSLGLQPGGYSLVHQFNDQLIASITASHSNRFFGIINPGYCTVAYDQASGSLFLELLLTLPADFIIRAYSSIFTVLTTLQNPYFGLGKLTFLIATFLCLMVTYIRSPRIGIHLTLIIAYLCAYPAIQFNQRHYFHIQFIPVIFLMLALLNVPGIVVQIRKRLNNPTGLHLEKDDKRALIRAIQFLAIVFLLPFLVLESARLYQARNLQNIADIYSRYIWHTIDLASEEIAPDKIQLLIPIPKEAAEEHGWPTKWYQTMYRISVDNASCEEPPSKIKVIYNAKSPSSDLAHSLRNSSGQQKTLNGDYYFQGYYSPTRNSLAALEITRNARRCITLVSVLHDAKQPDLWVDLNVIDERLNGTPYLTRR